MADEEQTSKAPKWAKENDQNQAASGDVSDGGKQERSEGEGENNEEESKEE